MSSSTWKYQFIEVSLAKQAARLTLNFKAGTPRTNPRVAAQFGSYASYRSTRPFRAPIGRIELKRGNQTTIAVALATLRQAWYRVKPDTAMRVRIVDVQLVCNSHYFSQLAAFFIDPRAK